MAMTEDKQYEELLFYDDFTHLTVGANYGINFSGDWLLTKKKYEENNNIKVLLIEVYDMDVESGLRDEEGCCMDLTVEEMEVLRDFLTEKINFFKNKEEK